MKSLLGAGAALASVLGTAACGTDPSLELRTGFAGGETFIKVDAPHTEPIGLCSGTQKDVDITITDVAFPASQGLDSRPEVVVDWAGDTAGAVPAVGASGAIDDCEDERTAARLDVTFPSGEGVPIVLERVDVTYEVEGAEKVASSSYLLTLCPPGKGATTKCEYP
jgi:hypothetical protein